PIACTSAPILMSPDCPRRMGILPVGTSATVTVARSAASSYLVTVPILMSSRVGSRPSTAGLKTTATDEYPLTTCQLVMIEPDVLISEPDPEPSLVNIRTTEGDMVR